MKTLLNTAALVLLMCGVATTASAQLTSMSRLVRGDEMADARFSHRAELRHVADVAASIEGEDAGEQIHAAVAQSIVEGAPDVTVVRTVLTGEKWIARVNELGIPKSEYRKGLVVYHVPGQSPIVRRIAVERPYFAPVDDATNYEVSLGSLR